MTGVDVVVADTEGREAGGAHPYTIYPVPKVDGTVHLTTQIRSEKHPRSHARFSAGAGRRRRRPVRPTLRCVATAVGGMQRLHYNPHRPIQPSHVLYSTTNTCTGISMLPPRRSLACLCPSGVWGGLPGRPAWGGGVAWRARGGLSPPAGAGEGQPASQGRQTTGGGTGTDGIVAFGYGACGSMYTTDCITNSRQKVTK